MKSRASFVGPNTSHSGTYYVDKGMILGDVLVGAMRKGWFDAPPRGVPPTRPARPRFYID